MEPRSCDICHDLETDVDTKVEPGVFIAAAEKCPKCSVLFRALQSVTDITRSEFTGLEIERGGEYLPKGVFQVRCLQTGVPMAGKLHNAYGNPFPNRYTIYTPKGTLLPEVAGKSSQCLPSIFLDAGESSAVPGLGLRDDSSEHYQEHMAAIDDRLQIAKSWLADCVANHADCGLPTPSWPRRVLDLSSDPIRLCLASSSVVDERYVALSYCWGRTGNVRTLRGNLDAHFKGISVASLPRTVTDAIYVCGALEVKYLWVDALCIVQDDTDDWTDQIPMMSNIYAGAHVVIAAQAASTVHDGCFTFGMGANAPMKRLEFDHIFDGEPRRVKLSIQEENQAYHLIPGHHSSRPAGDDDELDPLSTRAWAFQERFLARRVLFFSRSELSWKCARYKRCECQTTPRYSYAHNFDDFWGTGQLSEITGPGVEALKDPLKLLSIWGEVIRQFSDRNLTNWTDRLAAVQGVVVSLTEAFPQQFVTKDYMFGMWRQHIDRLLAWYRMPLDSLPENQKNPVGTLKGLLPSWSWAGTSGPVDYYAYAWDPESVMMVRVLNIKCDISNRAMLGGGRGTLTLSGLLIPTIGELDEMMGEFADPEFPLPDGFKSDDALAFGASLEIQLDDPEDVLGWQAVTHFLPLIREAGSSPKTQGIFLAPVDGSDNTFRRVGYHYDFACSMVFGREQEVEEYRAVFDLI